MSNTVDKDRERLLQSEAAYQDRKVTENIRGDLDKYYMDPAWAYLQKCKWRVIGDLEGKSVLDLGCGTGGATLDALQKGARVTAVDISPESVALVKREAKAIGKEDALRAEVMDAQHLDLADDTFDVVIGNGILHHLPELSQSLKEIRRVLKPSGHAVFVEPLGMNPLLNLYRNLTPDKRTPDEQPFRMREINIVREVFPGTRFTFFDLTTLISKALMAAKLDALAKKMQPRLIRADAALLRKRHLGRRDITLLQRMSWNVLIELK